MDNLCQDTFLRDTILSLLSFLASTSISTLLLYKIYRRYYFGSQQKVISTERIVINSKINSANGKILSNGDKANERRKIVNGHIADEELRASAISELQSTGIVSSLDSYVDDGNTSEDTHEEILSIVNKQIAEVDSKGTKTESDLDQSIEIDDNENGSDQELVNHHMSNGSIEDEMSNDKMIPDSIKSSHVDPDDSCVRIVESVTGFINHVASFQPIDSFASFVVVNKLNSDINVLSLSACASSLSDDKFGRTEVNSKKFSRISINDTRTVVIARRSLVKLIYQELSLINQHKYYHSLSVNQRHSYKLTNDLNHNSIQNFRNSYNSLRPKSPLQFNGTMESNLLEKCPDGKGYQLKSDLDLYLVLSKSLVDEMESERKLRKKMKVSSGNLMYEKLMHWSCLGVQGSILSHLIKPIYVHAILIPSNSKAKKLHSALSSKFDDLEDTFDHLVRSEQLLEDSDFNFNPPNVVGLRLDLESMIKSATDRPQSTISGKSSSSSGSNNNNNNGRSTCVSMICRHGHQVNGHPDAEIEYIYTDTGCTLSGHSSTLSKSSLFDEFGQLTFCRKSLSTVSWSKFYPSYPLNYLKVKNNAIPYRLIKERLTRKGVGRHVHEKNENNFNAFDPK